MSIFGTGFGQNNQQQQQQQPNTFGGAGFGAFGQNPQQQQLQQQQQRANPMFGNLASSSTPGGGFGGASISTNAFGQPKPTFGGTPAAGAFGNPQPSAFGTTSGGAFGTPGTGFGTSGSSGAGVFGQPAGQQQQQNAFGGGGSLFGKPQGTGFGSTALATTTVPATGSSNPPYQEFQEREQVGTTSTTLHYQSISCMPAYRNASFEELRVQDYQQGRKTANSFGNPAPTAFGQPTQQQQPSTGLFGQPATTGAFGQQQPAQSATSGFGAFGQPQQQQQQPPAFGAFGQPQQPQQQPPTGFGAFGQPQQAQQQQPATGFGVFGQQNQQQPQPQGTGFGVFGQQNQQNKGPGGFGQLPNNTTPFSAFGTGNATAPAAGTSLFAQPQQNPSPFGAFGQQNNQANQQQAGNSFLKPSVFGQPATGGGLFGNTGQQQQQQQPQQQGGLFGNTGQQQQPQGGGLFGQQPSGAGAFGQPLQQPQQQQQPGLFGQPSGGGLFGTANQQQNQPQQNQQAPGGGFGSLFSKPAGGGLFGTTNPAQQNQQQNPNPANPLFSGGGLFGNTNAQQQQQPTTTNPLFGGGNTGNLFGGKPPAPAPGFGGQGGGGLFGNTQQQQQTPALGGGLFGNMNTQSQPGQQQQPSLFGGSLFGGANNQQQQLQPSLTASIDQPLPSTAPTTIPQLPSLASSFSPKKKSNVFADVAARSSPRLGLGVGLNYTPPGPGSKLRGFGTSVSTSTATKNPFTLPPPGASGKGGLGFSESKSLLSPDAFTSGSGGSLQLLGGARQSVKKLVLDRRVDEEELQRMRAHGGGTSPTRREIKFNPALSVAAREKDNLPRRPSPPGSAPAQAAHRATSKPSSTSNAPPTDKPAVSDLASLAAPLDPQEGEYWSLPTVAELQRLSFSELQAVKDFTVGRVGFGTIQFLQPVDLTSVPSIADIPGKIVTFEHVECTLYADERLRPPPGEGLNVPARIKLDRCWVLDKSTREPIKDANDPKHQQRIRKMQAQEGAEFVGFDMETGVWEFIVQEF